MIYQAQIKLEGFKEHEESFSHMHYAPQRESLASNGTTPPSFLQDVGVKLIKLRIEINI